MSGLFNLFYLRYVELQKEIEHLHWQLNKMENSRKLYELATTQLVTFLEQVCAYMYRLSRYPCPISCLLL